MTALSLSDSTSPLDDFVAPDTHQKALAVNLDATSFGSFAEIGAGLASHKSTCSDRAIA